MKTFAVRLLLARAVNVICTCILLFAVRSWAAEPDLPEPWTKISNLSEQQRAQIKQIVTFYQKKIEVEKANNIRSRTAFHQAGGTMNLATNDIIQWNHQAVRINGLLERRDIMAVLNPQQQREADGLWASIDRVEVAENFHPFEVKQKNAMWCWAASISAVLNYNGVAWDQERVAQEIKGTSDSWDKATATEIADGLNQMKISADPRQSWVAMCRHVHGAIDAPAVINALEFGRPLLAALNETHVVVIYKVVYREDVSSGQRDVKSVDYFDPFSDKEQSITVAEGLKKITDIWYPSVSPLPNSRFTVPSFPGNRF